RHLLIQQHHAIRLPLQQHQGVIPVGGLLDREALLLEEQDVGGEALDLVVHPEDTAGAWHEPKIGWDRARERDGRRALSESAADPVSRLHSPVCSSPPYY